MDGMFLMLLPWRENFKHQIFVVCLFVRVFFPFDIIYVFFSLYFRADRMAQLLDERDLGVLTSSMSLLVALVANNHEAYWSCLPKCVKILERLARNQDIPQEYTYYGIPSPWLQVCDFFPSRFHCMFWQQLSLCPFLALD